jgi:hypothetical protein
MGVLKQAAEKALQCLDFLDGYATDARDHKVAQAGIRALTAALAQPDTEMQTYKDALTWISSVNAMDYEYQRKAINALKAHGIGGEV